MKEILDRLYIGDEIDASEHFDGREVKKGWAIVHAAKEPYHRAALGYTGRAAEKDHPEYLIARRPRRLILNMVDANETRYFSRPLFEVALDFIEEQRKKGLNVLVHCNKGQSRAPSIGLLAVAREAAESEPAGFPSRFEDAVEYFVENRYPGYDPAPGIRAFLKQNWFDLVPGLRGE